MNIAEIKQRIASSPSGIIIELLNRVSRLEKEIEILRETKSDKRKRNGNK